MADHNLLSIPNVGDFNEVALSLPADLLEADWTDLGKKLAPLAQNHSAAWWVGDWLNFGIEKYGKHAAYRLYRQAVPNKLADSTLFMYRRVSERFKTYNRIVGLSWSHHQAVETLNEQDQKLLLQQALLNDYSVERVRDLAAQLKIAPKPKPKPGVQTPQSGPSVSTGILLYPDDRRLIDALAITRSGNAKHRREIVGQIIHEWIAANRAELLAEIAAKEQEVAHAAVEANAPLFAA